MTQTKTIKRHVWIRWEDKKRVFAQIKGKAAKENGDPIWYGAWLNRSDVKMTNVNYGFARQCDATIEFPETLASLFQIIND